MYSATFSRLLVYVSVLLFFTSASAKPTGVTKNILPGSLVERAVQSGRPLKQFDAKLPHASQLGRRQPGALSNAAVSASDPSANSADSSDVHSSNVAVSLSNPSVTTADPPSDFVNIAGDITNPDGVTNSNTPNSLNLAIDPASQGTSSPLAFSGTPSLFGSSGSIVTSGSISSQSSSDASDSTTAPGSTSASGSSTGPGGIASADTLPNNGQSALLSVPAAVNAPLQISGSNPTTSSGADNDYGIIGHLFKGILGGGPLGGGDTSNNLAQIVHIPSGPAINRNFPALDIAGYAATGFIPYPGTNAGYPSFITSVSNVHNPTVSPGDVAANSAGDVASGVVSGGVAGGTAQASTNPTAQSNDTPLISTAGNGRNLDANANAALTP